MHFRRILAFLPFWIFCNAFIAKAADTPPIFIIDTLFDERAIEPEYLHLLPDETKSLSIETIQRQEFLPLHHFPPLDKRKNESIYWTKMIFHNQLEQEQEYWLSVWAIRSDGYLVRSSGKIVTSTTGLVVPHKEKTVQTIKRRLANYLPIRLKSGEKATLYIKNEYGGSLPKLKEIDRIEAPFNVRMKTLEARSVQNFFSGFFHALLLILLLYCIFLRFVFQRKVCHLFGYFLFAL